MKLIIKVVLFVFLSLIFVEGKSQKRGLAAIDSMKKTLLKAPSIDTNQLKVIYKISDAYRNINTDSAMHYVLWGLNLSKKKNWLKGIAAFYDNLGSLYSNKGSYNKALEYYHTSLKINKQIKNRRNEAANIINIASVYQRRGDDAKALEYSFIALKKAEAIPDQKNIALLYANISDVYFSQKNDEMALSYSLKAYKAYQLIGDLSGIGNAADRIGVVYLSKNNLKEAELYFKEALRNYALTNDKLKQAISISHMALVFSNSPVKQLKYYEEAQRLFNQINPLHPNSITNLGNMGSYYRMAFSNTKNPLMAQQARYYLQKATESSKLVGDKDNMAFFLAELADLMENNGQYKGALSNFKKSKQISDSLYSQQNKNKIAALEAQYAFRKKEEVYQQEREIARLKIKQLYLYGILITVTICTVLIFLLSRSRIRQLRLKNELQIKNSEELQKELDYKNQLSKSELKAIRLQMNPHFIFNVLNSIEAYVMENDKRTASRLIQKFASLSRLILENSTKSMINADKEWKVLMLYTELEAMRYADVFTYSFSVDDDLQLKTLYLPPMLIQPLIENAILHGLIIDPKPGAHLAVNMRKTDHGICITVEDNGIGIEHASNKDVGNPIKEKSMGLAAVKERIEMINKELGTPQASFTIDVGPGKKGTVATVCLPIFEKNTAL